MNKHIQLFGYIVLVVALLIAVITTPTVSATSLENRLSEQTADKTHVDSKNGKEKEHPNGTKLHGKRSKKNKISSNSAHKEACTDKECTTDEDCCNGYDCEGVRLFNLALIPGGCEMADKKQIALKPDLQINH